MTIYDFAVNCDNDKEERFITLLKEHCRKRKLSFLWIRKENVRETVRQLEAHEIRIDLMLDMEATYHKPKDIYARVCYAVKDAGGAVINDPDRARMAIDKSVAHFELVNAEIPTPYTVVVRNWEPLKFKLSDEERSSLGSPFVIKPALGFAQKGVVREAKGTVQEIARARNFDKGDNFLLQERVDPVTLNGKRAWFRVLHIFDTIIPCWWDDQRSFYEHVTSKEFESLNLAPVVKIASRIASLSRMAWFSTEIAAEKKEDGRRFVTVDYINDQCDLTTQSESPKGVPDKIVEYVAEKFTSVARAPDPARAAAPKYKVLLKDTVLDVKGLGSPQALIRQEK